MPRGRAPKKKPTRKPASSPPPKQTQIEDPEVKRQAVAIRAMRDVEMEQLLTDLRLLRSLFSEEQLRAPALRVLEESFPNLLITRDLENGGFDVKWKPKEGGGYGDLRASVLNQFSSVGFPDFSANPSSIGGFDFSSNAEKTRFLGADNLQIGDLGLEGPSDVFGMQDGLQTPGFSSQRLSVGMTPKTLRLPKPGEMLLSVRGSPLGVYKEDNMEAIQESEEV